MAKKSRAIVERTFSESEREKYSRAISVITECQNKAEGLAERIAGQLYIVSKKDLYRIDNYTSMGEWASAKFDISKGTCSDAINTYQRFGSKDNIGVIDDKYADYMFSTLIAMKSLTDKQIKDAGIDPTMSRSAVKQAITALKALEDKEKGRPEAMKRLDSLTKAVHAVCKDKEHVRNLIEETVPDWFAPGKRNNVDEINACISTMTAELETLTAEQETTESSTIENEQETTEYSTVENESIEPDDRTSVNEMVEETKGMTDKQEDISDADAIPQILLNIEEFRKEDGSINKKQFLDMVWKVAQETMNHNEEILITWSI